MLRNVERELLDELPAGDTRAVHARRDLQKINILMGNARIVSRLLQGARSIIELGAGDGTLLLQVASRLGPAPAPIRATLVDRHPSLSGHSRAAFEALGWQVEMIAADVVEWLERRDAVAADAVIANLFLHHFERRELASLLGHASQQTRRFVACEPRRSHTALAGAVLLGLIGCNSVTRHDAKVSVRAGFRDRELSALWPGGKGWRLTEGRIGPFTHAFAAHHEDIV